MDKTILYIHGKGGSSGEAAHYKPLFPDFDVIGFDYTSRTPWEAKDEFPLFWDRVCKDSSHVEIIANSIGAFFAMSALEDKNVAKAYFISPITDMGELICRMMSWANVTEEELRGRKEIPTDFGETLSWEYLCYGREHPVEWSVPTHILYGEKDNLTSYETIAAFARKSKASLTVMKNGDHWFHTRDQMEFLDQWIRLHR